MEKQIEAQKAIRKHCLGILEALGLDVESDGLRDTPGRMAKMFTQELCQGLFVPKPKMTTFLDRCDEMVVLEDIEVKSLCSHHMLSFFGKASVAYIPNRKIVGLSKISRLVDWCSRRPQVQERLTQQIAQELQKALQPKGVAVFMKCMHLCMIVRGVKQEGVCSTSALIGNFKKHKDTRDEFFNVLKVRGRL